MKKFIILFMIYISLPYSKAQSQFSQKEQTALLEESNIFENESTLDRDGGGECPFCGLHDSSNSKIK